MTVIAYRDGILAADRQGSFGSRLVVNCKLILRRRGAFGFAGVHDWQQLFIDWYEKGCHGLAPSMDPDLWVDALVVPKPFTNCVQMFGRYGEIPGITTPFNACGSGGDVALGAMLHGASAIEAVGYATEVQADCGCGIDFIDMHQTRKGVQHLDR